MRTLQISGLLAIAVTLSACTQVSTLISSGPSASEVHQASLELDAHADIVIPSTSKSYQGADGRSKVAPDKLRAGGVDAVVMTIATGPRARTAAGRAEARAIADEKLAAILALAATASDLTIATSVEEIVAAKNKGQTAFILGLQNAIILEGAVSNLDVFYDAGVRIFAFNHIGHNAFSDSSRPVYDGATKTYEVTEEHGGLSDLGKAAVKRINALGGVIDVSQMSKNATLQAAALSKTPVIATHSGVRALSNVTRNLSDEEIDLIGERGGVVHIPVFGAYLVDLSDPQLLARIKAVRLEAGLPEAWAYPYELYWELPNKEAQQAFLGEMKATIGTPSLDRMIDHIDYVARRIGIDHVGIGSDFNHGGGIEGFQEADEAANMTKALLARGYSADDVARIWGGNFLRVLREAEEGVQAPTSTIGFLQNRNHPKVAP
jgi:membrane dipeptidase